MFVPLLGCMVENTTTLELSDMTRTETTAAIRSAKQAGAHNHRAKDCRCGQGLDVCVGAHCPRCGRSLQRS
jgi:hypothetical protein